MKTIYRYTGYGPLDRWIKVKSAPGRLVHTELEHPADVGEQAFAFWIETTQPDLTEVWEYLVVETGHPYPADAEQIHTIRSRDFTFHLTRRRVK